MYSGVNPDVLPVGIYSRYHQFGTDERLARNSCLAIIDFFPPVSLLAPPWHLSDGYLSEVSGCDFSVSYRWDAGSRIEIRSYDTPVGTISQTSIKDPTYGSDWVRKHYLESEDDYRVMTYIAEHTVFEEQGKAVIRRKKDLGDDGVLIGRLDRSPYQKVLVELAGPEGFLTTLHTTPHVVEPLLEVLERRSREQLELALSSPVDCVWQPDNVTTELTPPDAFSKYCLPLYRHAGERCREAGKPYLVHIDGKLEAILDLVSSASIDVIESISVAGYAGDVTPAQVRKACPGSVLAFNFPASLAESPEVTIREYLDSCVRELGEDWRYFWQLSEDIPRDTYTGVLPALTGYFMDLASR